MSQELLDSVVDEVASQRLMVPICEACLRLYKYLLSLTNLLVELPHPEGIASCMLLFPEGSGRTLALFQIGRD